MRTKNQLSRSIILGAALEEAAVAALIASESHKIIAYTSLDRLAVSQDSQTQDKAFQRSLIQVIHALTQKQILLIRTLQVSDRLLEEVRGMDNASRSEYNLLFNAVAKTVSQIEIMKQACRALPLQADREICSLLLETRRILDCLQQSGLQSPMDSPDRLKEETYHEFSAPDRKAMASPYLAKRKRIYSPVTVNRTNLKRSKTSKRRAAAVKNRKARDLKLRSAAIADFAAYRGITTSANLQPKVRP